MVGDINPGEGTRPEDRWGYDGNSSSGLSATFSPDAEEKGQGGNRHLAPVDLSVRSGETGPCVHKAGSRCSTKGFLPMKDLTPVPA